MDGLGGWGAEKVHMKAESWVCQENLWDIQRMEEERMTDPCMWSVPRLG